MIVFAESLPMIVIYHLGLYPLDRPTAGGESHLAERADSLHGLHDPPAHDPRLWARRPEHLRPYFGHQRSL